MSTKSETFHFSSNIVEQPFCSLLTAALDLFCLLPTHTMGKELSPSVRAQMQILHKIGMSKKKIGKLFSVSTTNVSKSLRRIQETGGYSSRSRSGRPKATSGRDVKRIVRHSSMNPSASSSDIKQNVFLPTEGPSCRTIRRRLLQAGLKSRKAARKPRLSPKNVKDRLAFCQKYKDWTVDQWRQVIFSDEVSVAQFGTSGVHVRRPKNTRYESRYVVPAVKNSPKVMMWGAISSSGGSGMWIQPPQTTINASGYIRILEENLLPSFGVRGATHFQHDGAPCHSAKSVKAWLQKNGIQMVGPWPGNSPDLNPIEHCWVMLKSGVRKLQPTSLSDLVLKLSHVWENDICPDVCDNLIASMPRRIKAVLKANGCHTKY